MPRNLNYPSLFHTQIRPQIMLRDNFSCVICNFQSVSNHCHHIDRNKSNNSLSNLVALCAGCHKFVHRKGVFIDFGLITSKSSPVISIEVGESFECFEPF